MMQAQQNATSAQKLSNKVRILLSEMDTKKDITRAAILNQVYVKSGCTLTTDGSRVSVRSIYLHIIYICVFIWDGW